MSNPTRLSVGIYETYYNLDEPRGFITLIGNTLREGYSLGTLDDFGNVLEFSDNAFTALSFSLAD